MSRVGCRATRQALLTDTFDGLIRFVGLFNTLFLLPLIPILSALGIETFDFPTRKQDLTVCAINMAITLSSDYLYVLAMLKTTPLGESSCRAHEQCSPADIYLFPSCPHVTMNG